MEAIDFLNVDHPSMDPRVRGGSTAAYRFRIELDSKIATERKDIGEPRRRVHGARRSRFVFPFVGIRDKHDRLFQVGRGFDFG